MRGCFRFSNETSLVHSIPNFIVDTTTNWLSTEVREQKRSERIDRNGKSHSPRPSCRRIFLTPHSSIELGQSLYHLQHTKTESKYRLNLIIIIDWVNVSKFNEKRKQNTRALHQIHNHYVWYREGRRRRRPLTVAKAILSVYTNCPAPASSRERSQTKFVNENAWISTSPFVLFWPFPLQTMCIVCSRSFFNEKKKKERKSKEDRCHIARACLSPMRSL